MTVDQYLRAADERARQLADDAIMRATRADGTVCWATVAARLRVTLLDVCTDAALHAYRMAQRLHDMREGVAS